MNTLNTLMPLYVLKVKGHHGLIFKTKHPSTNYLQQVGEEMINWPKSHYLEYEIHASDHSNSEMTQAEILLHPIFD
ncbi:hypothetical protein [Thiomicrorhabdus sp. Kp2]|uniref:hypothetical protein n=1 Tax=Thiomicrorhabdus sp. Kp2 TaxID=1123518 RepID=UPI000405462F|nr:hypothetical protein [Thiomicrorhabdus sp. Kp2]